MKIKKHWQNLKNNQSGIASMVIVILIMTLLTLVVLAMTQNSNREQRQALDRQLSSQAFYAAESGISDAKDFVVNPPPGVVSLDNEKLNCEGIHGAEAGDQFPGKDSQVGEFENTKYTCVLYDRTPETLRYSSIEVGKSTIVPIQDIGGVDIFSLTFTWTKEDGGTSFGGCPGTGKDLPRQLSVDECEAGLLRIELVDPGYTNRPELIQNTFLAYVRPSTSGTGTFDYTDAAGSVAEQGAVTNGTCDSNGCKLTIDSIDKEKLYLNLSSLYKANQVTISGQKDDGTAVQFRNAQMEVDSTGQAGDILRRVQEMIDLSGLNSGFIPGFVLQTSSDVCKQLEVRPDRVDDNC